MQTPVTTTISFKQSCASSDDYKLAAHDLQAALITEDLHSALENFLPFHMVLRKSQLYKIDLTYKYLFSIWYGRIWRSSCQWSNECQLVTHLFRYHFYILVAVISTCYKMQFTLLAVAKKKIDVWIFVHNLDFWSHPQFKCVMWGGSLMQKLPPFKTIHDINLICKMP